MHATTGETVHQHDGRWHGDRLDNEVDISTYGLA
jgi:hypothetical protein